MLVHSNKVRKGRDGTDAKGLREELYGSGAVGGVSVLPPTKISFSGLDLSLTGRRTEGSCHGSGA